jgi:hypothetical protein
MDGALQDLHVLYEDAAVAGEVLRFVGAAGAVDSDGGTGVVEGDGVIDAAAVDVEGVFAAAAVEMGVVTGDQDDRVVSAAGVDVIAASCAEIAESDHIVAVAAGDVGGEAESVVEEEVGGAAAFDVDVFGDAGEVGLLAGVVVDDGEVVQAEHAVEIFDDGEIAASAAAGDDQVAGRGYGLAPVGKRDRGEHSTRFQYLKHLQLLRQRGDSERVGNIARILKKTNAKERKSRGNRELSAAGALYKRVNPRQTTTTPAAPGSPKFTRVSVMHQSLAGSSRQKRFKAWSFAR